MEGSVEGLGVSKQLLTMGWKYEIETTMLHNDFKVRDFRVISKISMLSSMPLVPRARQVQDRSLAPPAQPITPSYAYWSYLKRTRLRQSNRLSAESARSPDSIVER